MAKMYGCFKGRGGDSAAMASGSPDQTTNQEPAEVREECSGKKKSKFQTFKKFFARKKRKEPSSGGAEAGLKASQSIDNVSKTLESSALTRSEKDKGSGSKVSLGGKAMSHDSVFVSDSSEANEAVGASQDSIHGKVKSLQMQLKQAIRLGSPPSLMCVKKSEDAATMSEDDGLPCSPPEHAPLRWRQDHRNSSSSLHGCTSDNDQWSCGASSRAGSPLVVPVDFSQPASPFACLDNSAAKHKMGLRPKAHNRRKPAMRLDGKTEAGSAAEEKLVICTPGAETNATQEEEEAKEAQDEEEEKNPEDVNDDQLKPKAERTAEEEEEEENRLPDDPRLSLSGGEEDGEDESEADVSHGPDTSCGAEQSVSEEETSDGPPESSSAASPLDPPRTTPEPPAGSSERVTPTTSSTEEPESGSTSGEEADFQKEEEEDGESSLLEEVLSSLKTPLNSCSLGREEVEEETEDKEEEKEEEHVDILTTPLCSVVSEQIPDDPKDSQQEEEDSVEEEEEEEEAGNEEEEEVLDEEEDHLVVENFHKHHEEETKEEEEEEDKNTPTSLEEEEEMEELVNLEEDKNQVEEDEVDQQEDEEEEEKRPEMSPCSLDEEDQRRSPLEEEEEIANVVDEETQQDDNEDFNQNCEHSEEDEEEKREVDVVEEEVEEEVTDKQEVEQESNDVNPLHPDSPQEEVISPSSKTSILSINLVSPSSEKAFQFAPAIVCPEHSVTESPTAEEEEEAEAATEEVAKEEEKSQQEPKGSPPVTPSPEETKVRFTIAPAWQRSQCLTTRVCASSPKEEQEVTVRAPAAEAEPAGGAACDSSGAKAAGSPTFKSQRAPSPAADGAAATGANPDNPFGVRLRKTSTLLRFNSEEENPEAAAESGNPPLSSPQVCSKPAVSQSVCNKPALPKKPEVSTEAAGKPKRFSDPPRADPPSWISVAKQKQKIYKENSLEEIKKEEQEKKSSPPKKEPRSKAAESSIQVVQPETFKPSVSPEKDLQRALSPQTPAPSQPFKSPLLPVAPKPQVPPPVAKHPLPPPTPVPVHSKHPSTPASKPSFVSRTTPEKSPSRSAGPSGQRGLPPPALPQDEPPWMALAKKKAKAWSEMPQIVQ